MSTTATVPIAIRVDLDALANHERELDAALRAAVGRALATAAARVPAGHAWTGYVHVHWWGDAYDETDKDIYEARGAAIRTTIRELARKQGIDVRVPAPVLDLVATGEQLKSPDASVRAGAFSAIAKRVEDGDWEAFWLALQAIRADDAPPTGAVFLALGILRRRDPAKFAQYLEHVLGDTPLVTIQRLDRDVYIGHEAWLHRPALAGALRVARRYPLLARARLQAAPGLTRVLGLLDAQRALFVDLAGEAEHAWRADRATRETIGSRAATTQGLAGVLFAYAADTRVQALLRGLEPDIVENVRWLGWALGELRRIAAILDLYEEIFDIPAADTQEEVQVLAEAQALILRQIADNPLPRTQISRSLQAQAEEALAGWQLAAADRRVGRLTREVRELVEVSSKLELVSPYAERVMGFDPAGDVRVPYAYRLEQARLAVRELEADVSIAAEHRRDLDALLALDARRDLAAYRLLILSFWQGTLELQQTWRRHEIGNVNDQSGWYAKVDRVRAEMLTAFDTPDFAHIGEHSGDWQSVLGGIESDLKYKADIENLTNLGIDLALFLITHKLARFLPETWSGVRLTLIQAASFTVLSTVAHAALPGTHVRDPSATLNDFAETFASFGLMGIVDKLATIGALRFLRGRPVAQLVTILSVDAVAATALPVLVSEIARDDGRRRWTEQDASMIVGGLLLNAALGALTSGRTYGMLKAEQAGGLLASIEALQKDVVAWSGELNAALDTGSLGGRGFGRMRTRGVRLFGRLRGSLERLAALPEEAFGATGEVRAALRREAAQLGELEHFLHNAEAPRGPGSPAEVAPDAVTARGAGVFEYDPHAAGSPVLSRRLHDAGYAVRDEGGVLLLSAGPDAPVEYRVVPAPAPPPARVLSAAEQTASRLVLGAAGPGEPRMRELLAGRDGHALLAAAQLEPELVRAAIVSETVEEPAALRRLERALREAQMPAEPLERALQMAGAAASARRAAAATGPYADLLAAADDAPRAREVLATADGRALLEAAKLAPDLTRGVVLTGLGSDQLVEAWVANGLPADRVPSARAGLDALLSAEGDAPLSGEQGFFAAAGDRDRAQMVLDRLRTNSPTGRQALLEAFEREPVLVRRALRATEQRTLTEALSELARRLQPTHIGDQDIFTVGEAIREVNAGARWAARQYAGYEAVRELLPGATAGDAGELVAAGYGPALRANPRVRAFAQQPGAAARLRRLVGQGGLTSRYGTDPLEVFNVLERVLARHANDTPGQLGQLVDSLASPLSDLSDAELARVAGEVDPQVQPLLDRLSRDELDVLRMREVPGGQYLDADVIASIRSKLSDAELNQVLEALFPALSEPVTGPPSKAKVGGLTVPLGQRASGGRYEPAGHRRMDADEVRLFPGETPADAIDRLATVIGRRIADIRVLDRLWAQARLTVLGNRNPHTDVSRAEMLADNGIYARVRDEFWRLTRVDGEATFFLRIRGFDLAGTGAPLVEVNPQSTATRQDRVITLDHMEGFEKATGNNYRFAVDAGNLSFEFGFPNTLRDAIGKRLKLGSYAPTPPGLP